MSKKWLARAARFTRRIAEFLVPVLTVIKLLVEIASKAANCHDRAITNSSIARAVRSFSCRPKGANVKGRKIEYHSCIGAWIFPDYFYHYKTGGHVAALHAHLG